ncbi:hypothetical protein UlMin_038322 [Ulmus minor]
MGSSGATKPHAVCVPFPAQGHVNPMMQLAKLLHSKGFHITFVNTEFNHKRLIRSKGPEFLLLKLKSLSEVPPVSCIVSDGIMSFGIKAAEEFGIPEVQFWTAAACSFMGYLIHLLIKLDRHQNLLLKYFCGKLCNLNKYKMLINHRCFSKIHHKFVLNLFGSKTMGLKP